LKSIYTNRGIWEFPISANFLTSHLGIRLEKVERIILDEVTKMPNERENYEGIVKRGLKDEWCGYIRREYEFSMAVCRSLASDFERFMKEARGELKERSCSTGLSNPIYPLVLKQTR